MFHHAAPHGHTVYWSECLMSFCTPAVLADAYTLTKNAHVLLYPIPPMLTPYRQNGFSYQITLYHMTASSSPIVLARCSRCRIPKPLWSQFDWDNCDISQLHCCHQYCGYVLFVYLSVTEYVFNLTAIKRYAGSILNKWEIPHQFNIPENNAFVLATKRVCYIYIEVFHIYTMKIFFSALLKTPNIQYSNLLWFIFITIWMHSEKLFI